MCSDDIPFMVIVRELPQSVVYDIIFILTMVKYNLLLRKFSSASIVSDYQLDDQGLISSRGKELFL
jgi:hypothetical protein